MLRWALIPGLLALATGLRAAAAPPSLLDYGYPIPDRTRTWLADNDWRLMPGELALPALPVRIRRPEVDKVNRGGFDDPHEVHSPYDYSPWAEQLTPSGSRYALFVHSGLICSRDLWLGLDLNDDGAFEEVLPTGLCENAMVTDYAGRIELTDPQGELGLELELPHLLVRRNIPRYRRDASGGDSFAGFALEVRSLALDELHRDSDRDGLTDIAERMLQTDPRSRDSDGDGRADAADPTPNVDPAQMGVVERGVARALHYYFTEVDPERGQLQRERLPLSTKFIVTYCEPSGAFGLDELPCGPVAFSCGGDYGICLWTKEQVQHYAAALPYFSGDSVSVSSLTPRRDHPDEVSLWIEHTCILLRQVDGEYQPYETGGRMLF